MVKLSHLDILSHETGTRCNLSGEHTRCPSNSIDRYANLDRTALITDELILSDVKTAYGNGFNGILGWHFYNEPALEIDRIERLGHEVLKYKPDAKMCMWTNGTLITDKDEDPSEKRPLSWRRLGFLTGLIITNYEKRDWDWLKKEREGVYVRHGRLDHRLRPNPGNRTRCDRINRELVIDAYGNWRLCCADFVGGAVKMNVRTDGFQAIVDEYDRLRKIISSSPQGEGTPELCYSCRVRS